MITDKIIIAIDGLSSCGKSTLAKALARTLQYKYIDSGAMYRAITLYCIQNNIAIHHTDAIIQALPNIHIDFIQTASDNTVLLNGTDVTQAIRTLEVSNNVSQVSAIKEVRVHAVALQQAFGDQKGIVMDGRDIGTVVFPNAELKIYLQASKEVRIQRRWLEMQASQPDVTFEEVQANIEARDLMDTTRAESPLRKAEDAVILDNTELTPPQQIDIIKNWVNNIIQKQYAK